MDAKEQKFCFEFLDQDTLGKREQVSETWDGPPQPEKREWPSAAQISGGFGEAWDDVDLEDSDIKKLLKR